MFTGTHMANKKICDLAFEIEKRINPLAGYQDVYGCGVGNFKRIDFALNKQEVYKFLDLSFILDKYDMYLINTGIVRRSTKILQTIDVDKSYYLLSMVDKMEEAIVNENTKDFFKVFNQGWQTKKTTSKEIMNNPELIELEKHLTESKMVDGLKLCGAGGGGYFLVFLKNTMNVPFEKYFRQKYKKNTLIKIMIEGNGIQGKRI